MQGIGVLADGTEWEQGNFNSLILECIDAYEMCDLSHLLNPGPPQAYLNKSCTLR